MVVRVAITGGIACGKSLFSHTLSELGAEILDADEVVHALEAPGGAAVVPIRDLFGERVLGPDGGISRRALGEIVFSDSQARERLNGAVHPLVREAVQRWLERPGCGVRAAVIPLLFEVGWQDGWDLVVCLVSSEAEQIERLVRDRGLTPQQARSRVAAQMAAEEKAGRSGWVVHNHDGARALAAEAYRLYRFLMEKMNEH